MNTADPAPEPATEVDLTQRFVRVIREGADGLVAFEFAVGWPDMAVELAMPKAMFEDFCARNQVQRLADDAGSPALGQPCDDEADAASGDHPA